MAIYYFRNTGNTDWGTATNWSLTDGGGATGAVPTATDDAYFTSNSGSALVSVSNRVCNSLITTGFNGTITCSTTLTISGNVTLSATTTIAGTGLFSFSSATSNTYTSNGATINVATTRVVNTGTYVFADTWNVKGFIFNSTGATLNGGTLNISTDLTMTLPSGTGTTQINLTGTGTWSGTGILRNNLTINTAGTITISGSVSYNAGILTYTAGTVVTTGSTLTVNNSTTLDTDRGATKITWNNLTISISATSTITLSSNLNITGTTTLTSSGTFTLSFTGVGIFNPSGALLASSSFGGGNSIFTITVPNNLTVTNLTFTSTLNQPQTITLNGNSINITGNLSQSGSWIVNTSGTTNLNLIGTGTWSNALNGIMQNNVTINTSGTITISGNIYYNTGKLTYTSGTVITTGSTLNSSASTTFDTDRGVSKITWNNIVLSGTSQTFTLLSNLTTSGTLTLSGATAMTLTGNTINVSGNLTIANTATISGTTAFLFNGTGTWNHTAAGIIRNNVTINTASTLTIGTVIYFDTGTLTYTAGTVTTTGSTLSINAPTTLDTDRGATKIIWNNVSINLQSTSSITLSSNLNITGTTTLTGNTTMTISFAGVGAFNPSGALTINNAWGGGGSTLTITIPSTLNITNLTLSATANQPQTIALNGNTINISGNLLTGTGGRTLNVNGTTNLNLTGTGTWSNSSNGTIQNNMTINTVGTVTISGNVYYNTGTFTYTTGTVVVTGSTLNVAANTTFDTNSMIWGNVTFTATSTMTLTSKLVVGGLLTLNNVTFTTNAVHAQGNISVTTSTGSGLIIINGTGNQTWNTGGQAIRTDLTINKPSGTLILGASVSFNNGTLTYIAGTVDATTNNSTLTVNLNGTTTFNTSGMTWNNILTAGILTIALTSNLNTTNLTVSTTSLSFTLGGNSLFITTLTVSGSSTLNLPSNIQVTNLVLGTGVNAPVVINGLFNLSVSGNFTQNHGAVQAASGTSTIVLNGTGTWSNLGGGGTLQNNLTINTSGTITISGSIYYQTGTITYLGGTTITTGSTLVLYSAPTLTTNNMSWNNILFASNGSYSMTLGSNLYLDGTFTIGGNGTINGAFNIYCINFTINNSTSGGAVVVATMSQIVYVYSTLTFGTSASGTGSNGATFYVFGNLTLGNGGGNSGTSQVIMVGTGTVSGTNSFNHPLTINTSGIITFSSVFNIASTFTYTSGIVRANTTTLNCVPSSGQTLIGMDKIAWKNVVLTSGQTFTMNKFFSGSPNTRTTISASSTTNYTITFQDGFEKIAKFVAISGATITRRNQLLVITDSKKSSTNSGIRYINSSPNGVAKGDPSIQNTLTVGLSTFLVSDPTKF